MRRRSLTNSHPGENLRLREQYRQENLFCELTPWLKKNLPGEVDADDPSGDVHHIFSKNIRYDLWSNMILVSRSVHMWLHRYPVDGKVLCVWKKHQKAELCLEEVQRASGKDSIGGTLVIGKPWFPEIKTLRDNLLELVDE